jgi:hypothetical protein
MNEENAMANRDRDVRELTTREIDDVAGGLSLHVGKGPLFPFPPSTGPTIPVDPKPVIVYV